MNRFIATRIVSIGLFISSLGLSMARLGNKLLENEIYRINRDINRLLNQ